MGLESPQRAEMPWWDYSRPPSALELLENNLAWKAARIVTHALLRGYLRGFHRFRAHGSDQLRHLRGHLIVANHASHLDAVALISAMPLRRVNSVRTLCAKDYFSVQPLKRTISFLIGNTIPMDRDRYDAEAIRYCRKVMREGANVIVFPEGTRSPDGLVGPFKPGVGLLALRYNLPVLPAFIRGAYESLRKGKVVPRPRRIEVAFARPVRYRGPSGDRRNWIGVAQDLHDRVARLAERLGKERTAHECSSDQDAEAARPHRRPAERRRPHRLRPRADLRQDGGLRVPEPALGEAAGREAP